MVAALIVAKATVAAERDVTLLLSELSHVSESFPDPQYSQAIVTILGNLIDNAIDAASLGAPPAHVTVRLVQTDDELTIRVSDTGPGIPAGAGRSIFRDGFTTKQAVAGTRRGIGLALVDQVTKRMGGRDHRDRRPRPGVHRRAADHVDGRDTVITTLVVDDDYRVADIHASMVERVPGFTVVGRAHTAAQARTEIARRKPDLVLLDLYLPDEHGLDLIRLGPGTAP